VIEQDTHVEDLARAIYEAWARKVHGEHSAYFKERTWEKAGEVPRERAFVQAEAAMEWMDRFNRPREQ
jgi:hypothetical protein